MTAKVSSFAHVQLEGADYLFFVVIDPRLTDPFSKFLRKELDAFGENIGLKGRVILPYRMDSETAGRVINKPWPDDIQNGLRAYDAPFILMVSSSFADFDPNRCDWRLVLISETASASKYVSSFLARLTRTLGRGESPFEYLDGARDTKGLALFGRVIAPGERFAKPDVQTRRGCLAEGFGLINEIVAVCREQGLAQTEGHRGSVIAHAVDRLSKRHPGEFKFRATSVENALRAKWNVIDGELKRD